ncbi:hypothetical protein BU24DRAFT_445776 [Aaosphaeria arxii CBS 175.79]|uniref:ferric-chelate reductase (NADPH) n=1 Tax=Aaosphaeria arxii CBS 175.79 TaxID=1450172 RepID=A0A6A5Y4Z1_9PLEO|nr:uncharacterized protein BU24DRAFT_445776 [Aaosphaeria arxii CBS 175.79]KAF2020578.1 hypothetical protein BU24DRAFT_445776 [Aaosphaeria arxii CBS 175.79]
MVLGYEFVTLDDDQKHARRMLLEFYPWIAQWSVLTVFLIFQLCFLASWIGRRGLESQMRPRSPSFNKRDGVLLVWLRRAQETFHAWVWWMHRPLFRNWGTRGEWIGGGIWFIWLMSLSIIQTGNDFLHLTKRFGIIGASQLPLHYLLAMRSPWSPIQMLTRLSHEQLKSAHKILGRIVYVLFILHAAFYLYFFIAAGVLAKRIKDRDVIFGIISLAFFTIISTTALEQVRRRNYRLFYISHISFANVVILAMFLHVSHIRIYVWEVIAVNAIHLLSRSLSVRKRPGTVKLLPGTNLVEVRIPLSPGDPALKWLPGQHVYLTKPTQNAATLPFYEELLLMTQTNPFTIASLPSEDRHLLLVARPLNGTTKHLADLARTWSSSSHANDTPPTIPLAIEGPYGASTRLPDFSAFDEVLLVAGGVGATFIVPLFRHVTGSKVASNAGAPHVHLAWAVRSLAETRWASDAFALAGDGGDENGDGSVDGDVKIYVTGSSSTPGPQVGASEADIELAENEQLLSGADEEEAGPAAKGVTVARGRPDVVGIVDEVFAKGSRVAVFCCGPKALTERLGRAMEPWVRKGYDVYYHDETFGW